MNRTRLARTAAVVGSIVLATTGCGRIAEKATEEIAERAIESESGENVEIDFTEDGISIESDEGDVTLSADENGVQIDGTDADGNDFSVDADEGGVQVESEDGGGSLDIGEDGSFTVTDEDGEVVTGNVDADGDTVDFTVQGEDGEAVFSTSEGIPEQWPSDVPEPSDLTDVTGSYFSEGDQENIIVTGTTSQDGPSAFDDYVGELLDAGFSEESRFTQGDNASGQFLRGERSVNVNVIGNDDRTEMTVVVS